MVKLIVNARSLDHSGFMFILTMIAQSIGEGHQSGKGNGWSFSIQDVKSRKKEVK
jgi:hypothetical protein